MKKYLALLSLMLAGGSLVAAESESAAPAQKDWSFFVFLNADNNLDSYGVGDVDEMEEVGSTKGMNIVVEIDREDGPATRLHVAKGQSHTVANLGEVDMGDWKHLVEFVKWGAEKYPAKRYAVVIWNHGSGWNKKQPQALFKGISYDDSSNNHITTAQLTSASSEIKKVLGKNLDILAFDACLMQMGEVVYAVKDNVDVVIGSEETEPGEGWPYNDILAPLAANSAMSPEAFASNIVEKYAKSYNGGSQGTSATTQSAVRTSSFGAFVDSLNAFCGDNLGKNTAAIKSALTKAQKFYYRSNIDLIHFLTCLESNLAETQGQDLSSLKALIGASKGVIVKNATTGDKMKFAQGMAIYFPEYESSFSAAYNSLDWAKGTKWDEFVKAFYKGGQLMDIVEDLQHGDATSLKTALVGAEEGFKTELKRAINQEIHVNKSITLPALVTEVEGLLK